MSIVSCQVEHSDVHTAVTIVTFSCSLYFCLKDSELLDVHGDEGDCCTEEEYFCDVSSSLSYNASMPIPFPMTVTRNSSAAPVFSFPDLSYPSAQKQVIVVPTKLNDMSQVQCKDDSDVKSDSLGDETALVYSQEADEYKLPNNELLPPGPLVSLVKDDLISTSNHKASLSSDVMLLQLEKTAKGVIHDTAVSSVGLGLPNESLTSHINQANNIIQDTSSTHADETNKDETLIEIKSEVHVQKESPLINESDLPCEPAVLQCVESEPRNPITGKVDILSDSLEAKTLNLDVASDSVKHVKPFSLAQPKHTAPEVAEVSDMTSQVSDVVTNSVGIDEPSVSDPDKTDISAESQNSKCDTGIKHSNNCVENKSDLSVGHVETHTEILTAGIMQNVEHETPKSNSNSAISSGADRHSENVQAESSYVKPLQDHSGSPYTSAESLCLPEPPSRSSSQGSLRKEGRAGRYHKRPAPTPPLRNSESEGEDWTEVQEPKILCDGNNKALACSKEHDEDVISPKEVRFEDSESAVTARLVLKPGVVRSLGPDSGMKAEVFVSRTPQNKSRKLKSKSKQGDSALSRLIGLPRNQFGNLTSYLPFWHGKQEAHASADIQSVSPEVHESTPACSERHKSSQSSDVNVNVISCSPGQRRRAPLADWE